MRRSFDRARLGRRRAGWPSALWLAGTALLVTMVVHVAALAVLGGPVSGPVSLRKPAAFAETGWLTAWSVALVLPLLRTRAWQRHAIGTATVLFGVGETAIIGFQAWRGVPSHYNFTTLLDTLLMRGGAAATAGVFIVGMVVLLVATVRTPRLPPSVRLGTAAGIVVLLVGCAVGLVMVFNNSGVFQGSVGAGFGSQASGYLGPDAATVGPQYLMVRPSTRGGDLVLVHAIAVHGLVLLAVPSVLLARTAISPVRQLPIVALAVGAVGLALVILLIQALRQLPLDELAAPELGVLGACALALAAAYAGVARALLERRRAERASERARTA